MTLSDILGTLESPQETRDRVRKANAVWIASTVRWEAKAGRTQDKSVPRAEVGRLLLAAGYSRAEKNPVLSTPKEETTLLSAATQGQKGKRRKSANKGGLHTQKFVSPNSDTPMSIQIGRFIGSDETGDKFECLARVRIGYRQDASGVSVPFAMARPPEGQTSYSDAEAEERAREIAHICNRDLEFITNADLSRAIREWFIEDHRAVQTMGHGNSYYLRPAAVEKVYDTLLTFLKRGWIRFETEAVLRGEHYAKADEAKVVHAASFSIVEDLDAIDNELRVAAEKRKSYTKNRSIGRAKAGYNTQMSNLEKLMAKLNLYGDIIDERLVSRIAKQKEELRQQFQCLLDGGTITVKPKKDDAPPTQRSPKSEVVSSEPPRVDVVDAPASEPELAAAGADGADDDDDPFANMF